MRRLILILCAWTLLSSLIGLGEGTAAEPGKNTWGPFRGQIIDADTGQPIPGAVALVVWLETVPTPVEAHQRFYDARVAVAGTDGRFEIPRHPRPFSAMRINEPMIDYFAPGYVLAEPLANPLDPDIVRLRKWGKVGTLPPEQRLWSEVTGGIHVWIPDERIVGLKDHVNTERRRMGLRPIRRLSGGPE